MSDLTARMALLRYNSFFSWCVQHRVVDKNPCDNVTRPDRSASREDALTDAELKLLWRACDQEGEPFGRLVKFILITGNGAASALDCDGPDSTAICGACPHSEEKWQGSRCAPVAAGISADTRREANRNRVRVQHDRRCSCGRL